MQRILITTVLAGMFIAGGGAFAADEDKIDFDRDVKGILSDNCFKCHGPDDKDRKEELRLDLREQLFAKRDDHFTVVPGKPGESELFKRIISDDEFVKMPPPDSGKTLTTKQIEVIRKWIEQGAEWKGHWAYVLISRPAVPDDERAPAGFVRNEIDRYVFGSLNRKRVQPAVEADRVTLIRRLSFDLTGLPPTTVEVAEFLADNSDGAYETLVDRLLNSPHFGERMALYWLDQVRFADTAGYHSDNHRDVWLYRDYVIKSFNENLPYSQFTVEQLAGDLLPQATRWQRIASGYNRLIKTTEEGGAQGKEYQAKYDADRVRNIAEVWMASTMGCCECHNHKFDPFTMKDFYSLAAMFGDIQERPVGRQAQTAVPTKEQAAKMQKLDAAIAPFRKIMNTQTPELEQSQQRWEVTRDAVVAPVPGQQPKKDNRITPPKDVLQILAIESGQRSKPQLAKLAAWYRTIAPELASTRQQLAAREKEKKAFQATIPTTLVSTTGNKRTIRLLARGNWLDDSGPVMSPAAPEFLPDMKTAGERATRLDFARWLVSPENPLTARVYVNRLWKTAFGEGLVRTLDDFGVQGEVPSHPKLLDWLAAEFVESGWDVKHMLKLMVMSGTYRQSSAVKAELRQRDPYNKWLARQNRFRLPAETVRDNALAVSGLLAETIGGRSVKPYQPAGYWMHLNFPKRKWVADTGENQYRRGLYTYIQRTFPHPSLLAFDATSREECTANRSRSNNPLQALVLLNDPTYVEAARVFAERIVSEGGKNDAERLQFAYRVCLSRDVQPTEARLLTALLHKHKAQYADDEKAADELLSVGQHKTPAGMNKAELAAWTSVTRVLLNLHETIVRR